MNAGDKVRWTTRAGVDFAGTVRYIPPWAPETLHITCDPKTCGCVQSSAGFHVAGTVTHHVELIVETELALW